MKRQILTTLNEVTTWFTNQFVEIVAVDVETIDNNHEGTLKYFKANMHTIAFCNGSEAMVIALGLSPEKDAIIEYLRSVFRHKIKMIVGHNIKYDLKILKKYNIPYKHCTLFCTMVASHLIRQDCKKGLKDQAAELLGATVTKFEDVKIDSKEFYEYAINDVVWTWELMLIYRQQLIAGELIDLFTKVEMPYQFTLVDMETAGIYIDTPRLHKQKKLLHEIKDNEMVAMLKLLNEPFTFQQTLLGEREIKTKVNFNSSQQLAKILFEDLKLEVVERSDKTQAPSIGKATMQRYIKSVPFVYHLARYKAAEKLISAFYETLPKFIDEDGMLRPDFNDTGTETGRMSSSKPNFQQIPKVGDAHLKDFPKIRECFAALPGHKLIACDYSGQELRVLAHLSGEEKLIQTFVDGKDLHLDTANNFFNLGIKEEDLYKRSPNYEATEAQFKFERNKAKAINFGIAYGKGAYGFSQDFQSSEEEAQKILDRYFNTYPAVKRSIEECKKFIQENGYAKTLIGRRRYFDQMGINEYTKKPYYSNASYREGFNFLIQGFSADMIRLAALECEKFIYKFNHWNLRMVMSVHDEIVFMVKEEHANDAKELIMSAFTNAVKLKVPIACECKIGDNYEQVK
jgi:DNA polymerase-1